VGSFGKLPNSLRRNRQKPGKPAGSAIPRLQASLVRCSRSQHIEPIPTQTEIIRMRRRPLKPRHMPPLKRRHPVDTHPVVTSEHQQLRRRRLNRRPATPRHLVLPTLIFRAGLPFTTQQIQHVAQRRTRMSLHPIPASRLPQLKRLGRPISGIKSEQLRRRHDRQRTPTHSHQETSPLSSASLLLTCGRQRALAAVRACLCPGRNPNSSPSSGKANESTSRRNNNR
jgi:hypothetical protein